VDFGGGSAFYGSVYAPEADFKFSGTSDAYGSFTANTITVAGTANIHYDEALSAAGPILIASWNEVNPK
jgi:hypothetical protein